jgi:hypothetical protein
MNCSFVFSFGRFGIVGLLFLCGLAASFALVDRLHLERWLFRWRNPLGAQDLVDLVEGLNPVEYLWEHWKQHTLPNVCPKDLWQLSDGARRTLRRLRRRPRLISAFWQQSSFAFD